MIRSIALNLKSTIIHLTLMSNRILMNPPFEMTTVRRCSLIEIQLCILKSLLNLLCLRIVLIYLDIDYFAIN